MVDSRVISGPLRAHFAREAVLPRRDLENAQAFLNTLEQAGGTLSATDLQKGGRLLKSLEDKTVGYEFAVAQLIAQEAVSPADLEKRVSAASQGLDAIQRTTDKLRSTLEKSR